MRAGEPCRDSPGTPSSAGPLPSAFQAGKAFCDPPPRWGFGRVWKTRGGGEHPTQQQELDPAPLLCLPLRHPAQFYTIGAVGVPHSRLPVSGEESCWSSCHPTRCITHCRVLLQWLYPSGEWARRWSALVPPLGVANPCVQGGESSSPAACFGWGKAGAGTSCPPGGN